MNLCYRLPSDINNEIAESINGEKINYCIPVDIDSKGLFCDGWIIISKSRIIIYANNKIVYNNIINKFDFFTAKGYTGTGVLYGSLNNNKFIIARFSKQYIIHYLFIAKALNEIRKKGFSKVYSKEEEKICQKCGNYYIPGTRICSNCTSRKTSFIRLFKIAKDDYRLYLKAMLLFIFIAVINVIQPVFYRRLIDDVLTLKNQDIFLLSLYISLIAVSHAIRHGFSYFRGKIMSKAGNKLTMKLRNILFKKIQMQSIRYIERKKTGEIMNRINEDTRQLSDFIVSRCPESIIDIITLTGIIIVMFFTNWEMALVILVPVPLIVFSIVKTSPIVQRMFRQRTKQNDKANSVIQEILSGIRVVKAFGQEKAAVNKYRNESKKLSILTERNDKLWRTVYPSLFFLSGAGMYAILYMGGKNVLDGSIGIGQLVQFTQYAAMLYSPINNLSNFARTISEVTAGLERIYDMIDDDIEVEDIKTPVCKTIGGNVDFKNVTFGYESHEPVLEEINVSIRSGEMIGLVGHSGAGKTTFINLLMRLYDADEGIIEIDGINIKEYDSRKFKEQIGVVLQETFLFSGSIMDNIRYAKPNASLDEVIRAAKIANAHEFITKFPDGYDTLAGQNGHRLSGGERQRIAIARAILVNPKILILDEATSSLDTQTEQNIQQALGRLIKGRTTFAIAHRLSTLKNTDRIIVIENGRLEEIGTHDELINKKGIYFNLVNVQKKMMGFREPVSG